MGIEPACQLFTGTLVLKTRGPTRRPDPSGWRRAYRGSRPFEVREPFVVTRAAQSRWCLQGTGLDEPSCCLVHVVLPRLAASVCTAFAATQASCGASSAFVAQEREDVPDDLGDQDVRQVPLVLDDHDARVGQPRHQVPGIPQRSRHGGVFANRPELLPGPGVASQPSSGSGSVWRGPPVRPRRGSSTRHLVRRSVRKSSRSRNCGGCTRWFGGRRSIRGTSTGRSPVRPASSRPRDAGQPGTVAVPLSCTGGVPPRCFTHPSCGRPNGKCSQFGHGTTDPATSRGKGSMSPKPLMGRWTVCRLRLSVRARRRPPRESEL